MTRAPRPPASEEQFRALAENTPDVIRRFDRELNHVYVNAAGLALYGKPAGAVIGRPLGAVGLPEEERRLWSARILEVFETGRRLDSEDDLHTVAGPRFYQSHCVPECGPDGRVVHVLVLSRDLTDRRRAEESLRSSERRMRSLFEASPMDMALIGLDGRFLDLNRAALELHGFDAKEELIGTDCLALVDPECRETVRRKWAEALERGSVRDVELIQLRRDGSRIRTLVSATRLEDAGGKPYALLAMVQDVTERVEAESALRLGEARLRRVFDAGLLGVIQWTADGDIVDANDRFLEMVGYTREDLAAGRIDWRRMTPPEYEVRDMESLIELEATGVNRAPFEKEYIRRDGSRIPVLVAGAMLDEARTTGMAFVLDITERRRVEAQLREVAGKYSTLFDTTSDGVWIHDLEGAIVEVNDAYCRMSGYSRAELTGMSIGRLEAKETPPQIRDHIRALIAGGGHDRFESRHRRKDGEVFDVDITALLFQQDGGRIAIFVRDITRRKRMERLLQVRSEEQRTILDASPALIFYKDRENRFLHVNRAMEEAMGRPREQLEGKSLWDLYPRALADAYWKDDLEVIESGQAKRGIVETMETPRGTVILETDKIPYRDESGQVTGVVGFAVDVTERLAAEEALRRSEARLELLSEIAGRLLAAEDPQRVVDDLCRRVMAHLDCQAFFNFLADEPSGRLRLNACAGIPDEEARRIQWLDYGVAVCGCVAQNGERIIAEDIQHVDDPRTTLVRGYGMQAYCCHPLLAQDRLIGTLSFGTRTRPRFTTEEVELMRTVADQVAVAMQRVLDLRLLRELNESLEQRVVERTAQVRRQANQLRALAAELSQAEQRERKRLAAMLHDHIQQLLVAAQMHLNLAKRADPATVEPSLQGVESIIKEAISASRTLTVELSPPILHQAGLAPALGWLAGRMGEKSLFKVHVLAHSDAEPADEPIRLLLFESVRELLLNAVKHSGVREARVEMVRGDDGGTKIVVEDRGCGFDPAVLESREGGGFGLFSIQQRLAYLGGRMTVVSAPGAGTRIVLEAPPGAAREEPRGASLALLAAEGGAVAASPAKRGRISILLVDDHKIVRQGLSSILQLEPDLEVVGEAEDGRTALELARRLRPDVVVTDVSMPGMDGVELTRLLKQDLPNTKILGLSMHIENDVAVAMQKVGASGYLSKGGRSEDLIDAIRACVSRG